MKYINQEKYDKIKFKKENMYVVIDFDMTITSKDSCDSWDAAGKKLSKQFYKKMDELYTKYRPIEINYEMDYEEKYKLIDRWYKQCMDLYYEDKLTKKALNEGIKNSNLIFRSGAKEFLTTMYNYNVPVIILSAGIGNTIKIFLEQNDCLYTNIEIISNFLDFDDKGNVKKFNNSIINSLNKNLENKLSKEMEENIKNRKYCLLIGDALEDRKMVSQKQLKDTLTIGLLNQNIDKNIDVYKNNFDLVLTEEDGDFKEIIKILNKKTGKSY